MTRTDALPRGRALRVVLTAVAVVLGVLAMHAVSGGSHSASAPLSSAGAHATAGDASDGMVGDLVPAEHLASASAAGALLLDLAAGAAEAPDPQPMAMLAMCLAVLLAAFVLVRRLAQRPTALLRATRPAPAPRARRVAWQPPPDDLLLRICVMRT